MSSVPPITTERSILQNPQQLPPHPQVQTADLVQIPRTGFALFKQANFPLLRACEGPMLIPEKITLNSLGSDGRLRILRHVASLRDESDQSLVTGFILGWVLNLTP
jgi:hypothetical protein